MRYLERMLLCAVAAVACLAFASTASAATAPGYEEFADCPDRSVDPQTTACFSSVVSGGHLKLGSKDTPIVDPIRLKGSLSDSGTGVGGTFHVGSFDGGRQEVPGGMIGMTGLDWLIYLFPNSLLGLYAESQLAGTPGSPLADPFVLPLKIKLENPLLSSGCYIGSNANPVTLNLTSGTTSPPPPNTPISGNEGSLAFDPSLPGVIRIPDAVRVDNAFSVPAAQGCSFTFLGLINALVNAQAGLPSAAGRNTAVQEAAIGLAPIETVFPPNGIE